MDARLRGHDTRWRARRCRRYAYLFWTLFVVRIAILEAMLFFVPDSPSRPDDERSPLDLDAEVFDAAIRSSLPSLEHEIACLQDDP
jgi:hypothetical protein